ncbi:MAG: stage II sporulation protein P [Oscillospiraceae bacterium]|nr:stage II sporulation protein P [Oscillospiraceae bacterium]
MGQTIRILRRATAMALTLTAVWVCVRAAPLTSTAQALQTLAGDVEFAATLLQGHLPAGHMLDSASLDPWHQLVLTQSPLLYSIRLPAPNQSAAQPLAEPLPDTEDEPPLTDDTDSPAVERTLVPSSSQTYLRAGGIYIADRAKKNPDAASLAAAPNPVRLGGGPQVLIVHTHGSEAYYPTAAEPYTPSDPYRTTDSAHNMVRVGEEMAQVFRAGGFEVLHDTNLYDYPAYDGAYDRSRAAVERWLAQYPSIQIVLDVHRDALAAEDGTIYKAVSSENGQKAAQVMLVVGSDGKGDFHPLWQENLTFAMALQQQLLDDYDTLARPMVLRSSRFNQDLRAGSVLVEVGTHGNTLAEALAGARLFAQSTVTVLNELKQ